MQIGDKLKELRIDNNLTRIEVARAFGLAKEDIRDYEENIKVPEEALINDFASFYKVEKRRLEEDCLNLHETKKGTKNVILFLILSMLAIFNSLLVLLLLFFLDDKVTAGAEAGVIKGQYINKYFTLLFLFPFVGIYFVSLFLRMNNKNSHRLIFTVDLINIILEATIGVLAIAFYFNNIHDMKAISQNLFYSILGVLFFIGGFSVHPAINRPKAILGYRSKFTLSNDDAWYKVNTFLSYSVIITSVIFIIVNLFVKNYYFIFFMTIPFIATIVYHEILKIKSTRRCNWLQR